MLPPYYPSTTPGISIMAVLGCADILYIIFETLTMPDLARAACVCRLWNFVASDPETMIRSFKAPWKLKRILGNPSSRNFWRDNRLSRFALSHRLSPGDTVQGLAIKYSVQIMDIRRLNNMMSDHGIHSRDRLLIPVSRGDLLANETCYIELDPYAKREVAVVYLDGCSHDHLLDLSFERSAKWGKNRVIESLRRSMQADSLAAEYYLSISNGDPRAALSKYMEDLTWETSGHLH